MKKLIVFLAIALLAQQASAFVEGELAYPEFYGDRVGQVSRDKTAGHYKMILNKYGDWEPLWICDDKEISTSLRQLFKLTKRKSERLRRLLEDASDTGKPIHVQYFKGNPPPAGDGRSCIVDAALSAE